MNFIEQSECYFKVEISIPHKQLREEEASKSAAAAAAAAPATQPNNNV